MVIVAPPCPPIPDDLSIPQFIESNPYHNPPDRVIYIAAESGVTITFKEYLSFAKDLASGLRSARYDAGLNYGDLVLILSPNAHHYPMTYIGLMGAGLVPSPVSPAATAQELAAILELAQARAAIVDPSLMGLLKEAQNIAGNKAPKQHLSLMRPDSSSPLLSVFDLVEIGKQEPKQFEPLRARGRDTLALVPYSSGTTGPFKGVMLSHRNILANVIQLRQGWADYWEPRKTCLSFLADYHSYSHTQVCIVNAVSGMPTVRMMKYDFEEMLRAIERYKVHSLPIVPPVAVSLAKSPLTAKYDLRSVRRIMVAAAPTKEEIVLILEKKFNSVILQSFGCTEVAPTSHVLPAHHAEHHGSVGKLLPGMTCKVVGPDEKEVGPGEEGEFRLKGPNVFMGYYRVPSATEETFDEDGWYKMGDVGKVNPDGLFWVTDRIKELIKVKGLQVAPAELESVLLSHPQVLDAAVKRGLAESTELPVAFLVVAKENQTDAFTAAIKAFVASKVARYKQVEHVVYLDEIPKNPSGKILRRLLPTLKLAEPVRDAKLSKSVIEDQVRAKL